jgi:hypothetical protein
LASRPPSKQSCKTIRGADARTPTVTPVSWETPEDITRLHAQMLHELQTAIHVSIKQTSGSRKTDQTLVICCLPNFGQGKNKYRYSPPIIFISVCLPPLPPAATYILAFVVSEFSVCYVQCRYGGRSRGPTWSPTTHIHCYLHPSILHCNDIT